MPQTSSGLGITGGFRRGDASFEAVEFGLFRVGR